MSADLAPDATTLSEADRKALSLALGPRLYGIVASMQFSITALTERLKAVTDERDALRAKIGPEPCSACGGRGFVPGEYSSNGISQKPCPRGCVVWQYNAEPTPVERPDDFSCLFTGKHDHSLCAAAAQRGEAESTP